MLFALLDRAVSSTQNGGMPNLLRQVPVELISEGKTYKGSLDRVVKPVQPDQTLQPIGYITQFEKTLSAGFEVPDGTYTVRYSDGTPERKVRVVGGRDLLTP